MDDPQAAPRPNDAARDDSSHASYAEDGAPKGKDAERTGGWWTHWRRRIGFAAGAVVLLAVVLGGVWWWLSTRNIVSTNDAQIDGYITRLAPEVSGRVTKLLITDNEHVTAGQKLLKIDPQEYQVKLQQAQARKAKAAAQAVQARAQVVVQQAAVDQAQAKLRVAQAARVKAQQTYSRDQSLEPHGVSQQQVDNAVAALHSAQARQDAARQAIAAAKAQVKAAKARVQQAQAAEEQAKADIAAAKLQLSYCTIDAPVSGTIAHRTVAAGDYVHPGQALFAIVQDKVWITANFKETQLASMKVGDPVQISVDAVPSVTFHGKVQGFQHGTGSVFSVLPAENATGNYVKVVQRVPVKIVFDDKRVKHYRLFPGMSVEPSVHVR